MTRAKVVLLAATMVRCLDPAEPLDRPVTPLPQVKSCVPVEWQPPAPQPLAYEVLDPYLDNHGGFALDGEFFYTIRNGAIWRRRLGTDEDLLWQAPEPGAQISWVYDARSEQAFWSESGPEGFRWWWRDAVGQVQVIARGHRRAPGQRLISPELGLFVVDDQGWISRFDGGLRIPLIQLQAEPAPTIDVEGSLAVFTIPEGTNSAIWAYDGALHRMGTGSFAKAVGGAVIWHDDEGLVLARPGEPPVRLATGQFALGSAGEGGLLAFDGVPWVARGDGLSYPLRLSGMNYREGFRIAGDVIAWLEADAAPDSYTHDARLRFMHATHYRSVLAATGLRLGDGYESHSTALVRLSSQFLIFTTTTAPGLAYLPVPPSEVLACPPL